MTVYTKTITAGLALLLAGAPLVGTVSANDTGTSNGTVSFQNEAGSLSFGTINDIEFGNISLSSLSDFNPAATNGETGRVNLEQTSANPSGTYSISVSQTGDWMNGGETKVTKTNLPIKYSNLSLSSPQTFVSTTAAPSRGTTAKYFNHDSKTFTLDLTGSGDLTNALDKPLTSEVTWTLTAAAE